MPSLEQSNTPSPRRLRTAAAKRRAKQIAETGPVNSAVRNELMAVQATIFASVAMAVAVSDDGGGGGK